MLEKITNIKQIKCGDLVPLDRVNYPYETFGKVTEVNPDNNSFVYSCNIFSFDVFEKDLPKVVLFRETQGGLVVLAGEEAYNRLTQDSDSNSRQTTIPSRMAAMDTHIPEPASRGGGSFDMDPDDPKRPYDRPDGH